MPIITCPTCHNSYEVPTNMINRKIQCGFCGWVFTVSWNCMTFPNNAAECLYDVVMCTYDGKQYTKNHLLEIAKNQKWFIFFILLFFVFQCFFKAMWSSVAEIDTSLAYFFRFLLFLGGLSFFIAEAIFCLRMMFALQTNTALIIILVILSFLPVISIFIAVALNSKANYILKAAGLDVGFLGVSGFTIKQLQNQ